MDKDQHTTNEQSDPDFQTILNELISLKDTYVIKQLKWYETHARQPMILFRVSGVLIILLSVSIPFLATLEGLWRTIVLPIVALLVAGVTGLLSFFRWESDWKGYRQTQFTLDYLLSIWELKITQAKHERDTQQAIDMALQATQQLLDATYGTTSAEAEEYFQRVQIPRAKLDQ
jgi:uncharacterized protein DUF4231